MNKERFDEILAVSARLFREKGFRATSMEDISSEMGITKAALYYYIESKHDLLYEICDSAITRLIEGVREIEAEPGTPEVRLERLIRWHVNMFSVNGDIMNVYLADEGELEEGKRRHMRSLSREFEGIYRDILQEAIRSKDFRKLDVPVAVRAISGMCNWLSIWYRPDGRLTADQVADIFIDLILKGFKY
jgi:TetR/AcrR family transcriptional regulator, cholesterol catabolism regulator